MKKIRVLHILGSLSYGGIESMLLNMHKVIDKDSFQMDYVTCSTEKSEIEKLFVQEGANVYHITRRKVNILKHIAEMSSLLRHKKGYYDIIHVHMNNEAYIPLFIAKFCGYKIRIAHSHTSYIGRNIDFLSQIKCNLTRLLATNYAACSISAAEFLFGKNNINNVDIIHNCINFCDYEFDENKRKKFREEMNVENKIVIGYVSRLDKGKNHEYLCKIAQCPALRKCCFLIIGDGSERKNIENLIQQYKVENQFKMLGERNDVKDLLNSMDVFVMPSEHEGFPMVLVEAQANGLKCIVSKYVSKEVDLSKRVVFLDIKDENIDQWKQNILESKKMGRLDSCSRKYDAKTYVSDLEAYYTNLCRLNSDMRI